MLTMRLFLSKGTKGKKKPVTHQKLLNVLIYKPKRGILGIILYAKFGKYVLLNGNDVQTDGYKDGQRENIFPLH